MSQEIKYTAADFERYHSGKMDEAEMYALEKATLEDSFLSDALEGYAYTSTATKDIDELKEKLLQKKKKKNVFFLIQKQNVWLRVAAMFVLIAGIGYLAYQVNFNKENNKLATKQNVKDIKNPEEQTAVTKTDSPINKDVITLSQPKKAEELLLNKPAQKIPKSSPVIKNNTNESYQDDLKEEKRQTAIMQEAERDEAIMKRKENILKGRLVDTLGNPIKNATIKDKNTEAITTSDADGKFKLQTNDSTTTAVVSVIGYKSKEKILSPTTEPVIVMQHDTRPMEEVVVTANGSKKQKKELSTSTVLQGKVPGVVVNNSTPQTVTQNFDDYVKKNIKTPTDSDGKNYKGKVVLSFEINKKGDPKKIKVEQSLCADCDEEAIRLLKHGPKWNYIKDKKNSVTIEF